MRIAIHQPNFVPHFGFFYKMSQCDIFIILSKVQFEKNGYQNRYYLHGQKKWVTMPIEHGLDAIYKKQYFHGQPLMRINMAFIMWVHDLLGMTCEIVPDVTTDERSTARLISNLNHYGATTYITNPSAKDKYLDEDAIRSAGMDIEYSEHPDAKLNILEMFEKYGIEGTRRQLWKPKAASLKEGLS